MFLRDAAGRDASLVPQDFRPRPFGPPKNGSRPLPSRPSVQPCRTAFKIKFMPTFFRPKFHGINASYNFKTV